MKFSRQYQESLVSEGFPAAWVNSAISYRKLKKCIKLLQRELDGLGLDASTLRRLLESREEALGKQEDIEEEVEEGDEERPFMYTFDSRGGNSKANSPQSSPRIKAKKAVLPKLLFVVDEETGEPLGATFSEETRSFLHQLAVAEKLTSVRITDTKDDRASKRPPLARHESDESETQHDNDQHGIDGIPLSSREHRRSSANRATRLVQVPLVSDSSFFSLLETELNGLASLQEIEQTRLTNEIKAVGTMLSKATGADSKGAKADLTHWRRLFELYLDSRVFFIATEKDHTTYDSRKATKQWTEFLNKAQDAKLLEKWKVQDSKVVLRKFLTVNVELLKSMRFQEMNQMAMTKILKSKLQIHGYMDQIG
jgi:E3 ubiquitin-protein ligase BAH